MLLLRRFIYPHVLKNLNYVRKLEQTKFRTARIYFCTESSKSSSSEEEKQKTKSSNKKQDTNYNSNVESSALTLSFENVAEKSKNTYLDMITVFEGRSVHRRNHVEFIYAALKNMELFGVHRDIEIYKALINVMPKGKFIPTNLFQAEFMHYPKQQQCIIDLLEQMEDNGVMPDYEMEQMLLNIFGNRGHPLRKYWRMMYWMPKFKNLSPWLLPDPLPSETLELAKLAIQRMCTVDLQSKINVYETKEIKDSADDTWIVSGMSPEQSNLLKLHDKNKSLFIEGPFFIWLNDKNINYFTLRADPNLEKLKQFLDCDININDDNSDGKIIVSTYQLSI